MTDTEAVTEKTPRRRMTRRAFLLRLCGGGVGGLATAGLGASYARYVAPFQPATERVALDLPALHPDLVGFRLLQLSDLHLGPRMRDDYLRAQLRYCVELAPDAIVLTGDFITSADLRFVHELTALLHVLRAPLGVFAVLGNHDWAVYSDGRVNRAPALANGIQRALAEAGVTVLRNGMRVLERGGGRLQLVGLEDLWSGYFDANAAFAPVVADQPCIALAHNPDTIDSLQDKPWHWLLCGHTHGGQVRVPLLGAPFLPLRNRQYDAGLFAVGDRRLYVNRGLGYLRQIRFNCPPEITLFTFASRV